jgi:hypothetical protein
VRTNLCRRTLSLAVLAALTIVGLPGTATGATSESLVSLPPDCQVSPGATGMAICITSGAAAAGHLGSLTTASVRPSDCGDNAWVVQSRLSACRWSSVLVRKFTVPQGILVGTISLTVTSVVGTRGPDGTQWHQTFDYDVESFSGRVGTIELLANPDCGTACSLVSPIQVLTGLAVSSRSATQMFQSSGSAGQRWAAESDWEYRFFDPESVNQFTPLRRLGYPGHRCDDALPGSGPGCVQASYTPHLPLDRFASYPMYRNHIRAAIAQGDQPHLLNRTTNEVLRQANRAVSCPPSSPTYPRPAGYECDEYPFASTYQGAMGRTGEGFSLKLNTKLMILDCNVSWLPTQNQTPHRGYSACMIPAAQNSAGGGELSAFYRTNRIIDGDPFTVLHR